MLDNKIKELQEENRKYDHTINVLTQMIQEGILNNKQRKEYENRVITANTNKIMNQKIIDSYNILIIGKNNKKEVSSI